MTNKVLAKCLLGFIVLALFSCGSGEKQTLEYHLSDISLVLEGPMFPGSNESQAEIVFSPEEVLESAGVSRDNIKNIRVKEVTLRTNNEETFDLFESIVVQMVGGGSSLTSVAVQSPVPASSASLTPGVSEKAELAKFKSADKVFLVIDANINEDYEDDFELKADLVFLLEVSK
ncbi:hypothetical protein RCC89_13305 [Cytophagaceae bacterium ABcell3]|nr:hypothetical protein RCC89_13305 [Cytophagaceae bacterium ABcell3]